MTCKPRLAKLQDLPSWLELVSEVEDLFGPMADFEVHARRGIHRGTALVVAEGEQVHGAALLSRDGRPQHIRWLAVRGSARGRGVGAALLAAILDRWSTDDVEVVTFTQGTTGGEAARRLYERFGFQCLVRPIPPLMAGGGTCTPCVARPATEWCRTSQRPTFATSRTLDSHQDVERLDVIGQAILQHINQSL